MHPIPKDHRPRSVEEESRAFWAARGLPRPDGPLGPANGPLTRMVTGPVPPETPPLATALRLAWLDASARALVLVGQRVSGTLRPPLGSAEMAPASGPGPLEELGVWVGGGKLTPAPAPEAALRRTLLERLSADALLVARSVPVQVCANCRTPESPESVLYQPEEGSAYLVRFPLPGTDPVQSLLVSTDAAWKLLATTALLANPTLTYAVLRHERHGANELVVCLRSAVERLRAALPDSTLELVEEISGASLAGRPYRHPLAMEHPAVANLPAPGGTVVASEDLEDRGSGLLLLTPAHGVTDAEVAHALGLPGWPVVGLDGTLSHTVQHKYAGLSVDDAEAFVLRDLIDDGAIFAQLPVRRGVPRCAHCGSALFWTPARVWSLEPGRLPPDRLELFRHVVPDVPAPIPEASVPWPVSAFAVPDEPGAFGLTECDGCDRLAPDTAVGPCLCGGARTVVHRHLLPEFEEALAAWATVDSFPDGTSVRLLAPERRRGPALVHHLAAMHAARRRAGELRMLRLITLPTAGAALGPEESVDVLRTALLRTSSLSAGRASLEGRRREEAVRIRRIWATFGDILERITASGGALSAAPAGGAPSSMLEEDRAFLARFERMRLDVLQSYAADRLAEGLDRLLRFFDHELRDGYLKLVAPRLDAQGSPAPKLAALRLLLDVSPRWIELYAVAAPFTGEALWRAFRGDGSSIFEGTLTPPQRALLDPTAEEAYARWRSIAEAVRRWRPALGIPRGTRLTKLVLVVADEEVGVSLRAQTSVLARLLEAEAVEVGSPAHPWEGWKIEVHPSSAELQRAYGARAPRILRILQGLAPRRLQDGLKAGSLSVSIDGSNLELPASMFEITQGLPPDTCSVPWSEGVIYLQLPAGRAAPELPPPPPVSLDAFRMLRTAARRLQALPLDAAMPEVVVRSEGPLAEEVARLAAPMARYLHVPKVRPAGPDETLPAEETSQGSTGRGVPWRLWLPGVPKPTKVRKVRRRPRSSPRAAAPPVPATVDESQLEFLAEATRSREEGIRALLEALDAAPLPGPILGPAKLTELWQIGITSKPEIAAAPFEQLAGLPGFGPVLARELVLAVGGSPPPPKPRPAPARRFPPTPRAPVDTGPPASEPEPAAPLVVAETAPYQPELAPADEGRGGVEGPEPPPAEAEAEPGGDGAGDAVPAPLEAPEEARAANADEATVPAGPEEADVGEEAAATVEEVDSAPAPAAAADADLPTAALPPEPVTVAETEAPVPPEAPAVDAPPILSSTPSTPAATPPPPALAELVGAPTGPVPPSTDAPAPSPEPTPPAPIEEGVRLVTDGSRDATWARFLEAASAGHRGLCLTTLSPDRVRLYVGDRPVEILGLSQVPKPGTLRPSDLAGISRAVLTALQERGVTVLFLEGLEYLVSLHSAEKTAVALHEIDGVARTVHARVWVALNPELLPEPELQRLVLEFPDRP